MSTNLETWTWLASNHDNLMSYVTDAVRDSSTFNKAYGVHDGVKDIFWFSYSVRELADLIQNGMRAIYTPIELSRAVSHVQLLIYQLNIDASKALYGVLDRDSGYDDKSLVQQDERLGVFLAGRGTRLGSDLPLAKHRSCILCSKQGTVTTWQGETACKWVCADDCQTAVKVPNGISSNPIVLQSSSPAEGNEAAATDQALQYVCPVCDAGMPEAEARGHLAAHIVVSGERCPVASCSVKMKKQRDMLDHLKSHEQDATGRAKHVCSVCGKKYKHEHHLRTHESAHTGEFVCNDSDCENRDFDYHGLEMHRADVHGRLYGKLKAGNDELPHKCEHPACGKGFKNIHGLRSHTGKAHNKLKRPSAAMNRE